MYSHLAVEERYQISALLTQGLSLREIAGALGRSPSTISRELSRNRGLRGYRPLQANENAMERCRQSRSRPRIEETGWEICDALLRLGWSPEQIAGRTRAEGVLTISPEWLYQHVYEDKSQGGDLVLYLRCQKKRRKRYGSGRSRRGQIPRRRSINGRPARANARSERGHWEGDTIHEGRAGVVSAVDRKSRYVRLEKVSRRTASETRQALANCLEDLPVRTKSLTVDNGSEFTDHEGIAEDLGAGVYFADPYSSWQRGTNENTNGLVREYLPKGMDFEGVTDSELHQIEDQINFRPRKCLGYRTPHEVMYNQNLNLTDALRT